MLEQRKDAISASTTEPRNLFKNTYFRTAIDGELRRTYARSFATMAMATSTRAAVKPMPSLFNARAVTSMARFALCRR
jgi:hypothetical protein